MTGADHAHPIVSGIPAVVEASQWTFARIDPSGEPAAPFGSRPDGAGLDELALELKRQRSIVASGPRIAASLGSLEGFESGVTMIFADARATFGILTLWRTAELGPFTSSEISILTIALDAVSDHLSGLRAHPAPEFMEAAARAPVRLASDRPDDAFYVLDTDFMIVLTWSAEEERRVALSGVRTRVAERLPALLEATVREMTAGWATGGTNPPGIARPVAFLVVSTQPMSGPSGLFIGVRVDRFKPANSLTAAAARYRITPREVQVLALLLDGRHLDQIAKQLFITSSTVQDHIKSMLDKTGSGNRSELIARIFGWEYVPPKPPA